MAKFFTCVALGILGAACGALIAHVVMGYPIPQGAWYGDWGSVQHALPFWGWVVGAFIFGLGTPLFLTSLATPGRQKTAFRFGRSATLFVMLSTTGFMWGRHAMAQSAAAHLPEVATQPKIEPGQQAGTNTCIDYKARLDWLKYPNIDTSATNLLNGVEEGTCCYRYAPSDPPEKVVNYYLSRADSWQDEGASLRIYELLGGEVWEVYINVKPHGVIAVTPIQSPTKPVLKNAGPGIWQSSPIAPAPVVSQPKAAVPKEPTETPLEYPNATRESSDGEVRLMTSDAFEKVVGYYKGKGASAQADASIQGQTVMTKHVGNDLARITVTQVLDADAKGVGTLIMIGKA